MIFITHKYNLLILGYLRRQPVSRDSRPRHATRFLKIIQIIFIIIKHLRPIVAFQHVIFELSVILNSHLPSYFITSKDDHNGYFHFMQRGDVKERKEESKTVRTEYTNQ